MDHNNGQPSPHRVMVYGVTGSGKTTTAARLSGRLGVDWYAVDDLTWEPNWTPVDGDEQRRRSSRSATATAGSSTTATASGSTCRCGVPT